MAILISTRDGNTGSCSDCKQAFTSKHPKENQFLVVRDLKKQFEVHDTEKHIAVEPELPKQVPQSPAKTPEIPL